MTPPGPFAGASDRTTPIRAVSPPRRSRSAAARLTVVVASGVLALVLTATTAVVLVVRGTAPVAPAVATVPATPAPATAPVAAPAVTPEPGPALVDTNGDAVHPELAAAVTRVYRALDANDLESVRKAYSATGSDDWHTSESHLRSATVRNRILATLRERPSAHDGYLYASGNGYTVQFGQSDQYGPSGLLTIQGPWSYEYTTSAPQNPTSSSPVEPGSATTVSEPLSDEGSCAAGSVADRTEGLPCRDLETGRGVERDGTVGVHGLRPCPAGTTVPSDPDESTRNARTGEICAVY